ncbi:MAG: hypothetical protein IJJ33_11180 [Victivallales bacterium]|nr:hypothetical protein [Victivallales bacterium]
MKKLSIGHEEHFSAMGCLKLIELLVFLVALPSIGDEALKLRLIPSPNLVTNADFNADSDGLPQGWRFDNCSRSPRFQSKVVSASGGNVLGMDSAWEKYGYWLQSIPVKEGVAYYVSCDIQSDGPISAVWLKCLSADGQVGASWHFSRSLRHGDAMRKQDQKGIRPRVARFRLPEKAIEPSGGQLEKNTEAW